MWTLLEYARNGNGHIKTALVAVILAVAISVAAAWALDGVDTERRDRELDRLYKEMKLLREETNKMRQSLARIEAQLAVIVREPGD